MWADSLGFVSRESLKFSGFSYSKGAFFDVSFAAQIGRGSSQGVARRG